MPRNGCSSRACRSASKPCTRGRVAKACRRMAVSVAFADPGDARMIRRRNQIAKIVAHGQARRSAGTTSVPNISQASRNCSRVPERSKVARKWPAPTAWHCSIVCSATLPGEPAMNSSLPMENACETGVSSTSRSGVASRGSADKRCARHLFPDLRTPRAPPHRRCRSRSAGAMQSGPARTGCRRAPPHRDRRRRCSAPARPDGTRCRSSRHAALPYAPTPR